MQGMGRGGKGADGDWAECPLCAPPGLFFNPICCFLLFNVMDWLGRSLTSYFLWVSFSGLNQPEV